MADGAFGMSKELARETAPVWAKVKDHVTPMEWPAQAALISEINALKKTRDAVILAHNYMTPEIFHGVGDYVGDSLGLAREAARVSLPYFRGAYEETDKGGPGAFDPVTQADREAEAGADQVGPGAFAAHARAEIGVIVAPVAHLLDNGHDFARAIGVMGVEPGAEQHAVCAARG